MAGADQTCAKLLGALPRELAGQQTRPVTTAPHRVVAWGDPPIVLRCGVPARRPGIAQELVIERVAWVYRTEGSVDIWTTTSLAPPIEVRIDRKYRDTASTAIIHPLAAPLLANVPAKT